MCFSTTASFGASAILAIIGVATLKKVQAPSQLLFALFPIVFSIQQFIEGLVWISLTNPNYHHWQSIPIFIFVFFAQVIWTTWVPLAFYLMEKDKIRKKILLAFVIIGSAISVFHFYNLLFIDVTATINPYHVYYNIEFPLRHNKIIASFYLLTIVLPPLVSSIKKTYILGVLLLISFIITKFYFKDYVISVWCFFAALTSLVVFFIMKYLKKTTV